MHLARIGSAHRIRTGILPLGTRETLIFINQQKECQLADGRHGDDFARACFWAEPESEL
jgi:hypothetical protein